MRKVFLDTNILLDYGQERDEYEAANAIYKLGETGLVELYASYLSYANLGYILRHCPQAECYELISKMREGIVVLPCDAAQLDVTIRNPVKDYEDMLQYQCALAFGCDVIVTNNKKDFHEFCEIPFVTSEEFLLDFFTTEEQS